MSRIGKKPIDLPSKVEVNLSGVALGVKGPKGELATDIHPDMKLNISDREIVVERPTDGRRHRALHGMTRSIVQNMVTGVSTGFERSLQIEGVGYRAQVQGSTLTMNLGYSHPVEYAVPGDVKVDVKDQRVVTVQGIDKQRVGQVAAVIRGFKPPEPYKGTGIRYTDERILRKEGKAGAK